MKQLVDLSKRDDWEFGGYPCERTVTDKGYTLVFKCNPLPDFSGLDYIHKRLALRKQMFGETGYIVKYEGPDSICISEYHKDYKCCGRQIFANRHWVNVVRFDGKKVIVRKGSFNHDQIFTDFFLQYFGIECLSQQLPERVLMRILYSKTVLKAIFKQRLTNAREVIRLYMNTSWKLKDISYDLVLRGFKEYVDWNVAKYFVTSIEDYISFLEKYDYCTEEYRLFSDLLKDAEVLDIRVDPKWSKKRMLQEHQRNNEKIMLLFDTVLSDKPVRDGIETAIDGSVRGFILNTERETFRESSEMHHCIYSHYFNRIQAGTYIGISLVYPERCTVGLTYDGAKKNFVLEQVHTIRNGSVQADTRQLILDYIRENQLYLDSLGPSNSVIENGCRPPVVAVDVNLFLDLEDDLPY